ncbi:MAG TPA: primosomal protein N' [Planctomycetota bacterium]|nr:primosomal protein N' [Planctomycetota bacterium]
MPEFAEVVLNLPLDRSFTYRVPVALRDSVRPGMRVKVPFGPREQTGYVVRLADSASYPRIKDLKEASDEVLADERLLELTRWVASRYACSWGEAINAAIPSGVKTKNPGQVIRMIAAGTGEAKTAKQKGALEIARKLSAPLPRAEFVKAAAVSSAVVAAMVKAGLLVETQVRPEIDSMAEALVEPPKDIRLTPAQEEALRIVEQGGVVLLHGVTGSGKTEVYLRAIARAVERGQQAIVLVPEIALTPQTVARFKARFPRVAVLHSVLTQADRARQWRAIRNGEVDVIVGARSAVFAPTKSLGLIVLDEEHEGAYKQENDPRYHAREVAVHRAKIERATVILGSATPSLEAVYRAQTGEYRLARLPGRVEGREMPEIEVVDMAAEKLELKYHPIISRRLEQLMRGSMEREEQAILFLNRRGFLTHVSCRRCGWFFSCKRCDVAMTWHRQTSRAVCHYCYESQPMPATCPDCGAGSLALYGMGTERIEDELKNLFPGFAVSRMDSDSMKTRDDYRRSLGALWGGETDILVGTQMIAKGLDVPDVTLVGVVSADTAFHIPDFRSSERTFQLITQVAGRTGRGSKGGRVVVQTFYPKHDAVRMAATYDYDAFVRKELDQRRELGYPPFVTLVRALVHGWNEKRVAETAQQLGEKLRATFDESKLRVLGPAEPPLFKLKGRTRMHLLLKCPELEAVLPGIRRVADTFPNDNNLQVVLDVDPLNML